MNTVSVQVINSSENSLPQYETSGAAALDIKANVVETVIIPPGKHALIKTGLFMAIPEGYVLRLTGRSGLAFKANVEVHPGVIDSDYRGELGVVVHNFNEVDFVVSNGDRICQAYLQEVIRIHWDQVLILPETKRGTNGFGSTGVSK